MQIWCFSKIYSAIESTWSISSSKEETFSHVIVKHFLCSVLFTFLIKTEACGSTKSKNRHPSWLYCTVVGLSEAATSGVLQKKPCSYEYCNIRKKKVVLGSLFNKVEGLQACNSFKNRLQHICFLCILKLPILKNICESLLFDCFNGSMLHIPDVSRSVSYDKVRLLGSSHRFNFLFLSRHLWSWSNAPSSGTCFKNLKRTPLMSQLSF